MPDGGAVQHQAAQEPEAAPAAEEPVAGEAAEGAEQPESEQTDEERPQKGRKAREWEAARRLRAQAAKEQREAKREREALTKERAELQKLQQEMQEWRDLLQKSPADFAKKLNGGNIRPLLQKALDEEELTEEQRTIRAQQEALEELKNELKSIREETSKEREEREKREKEQEQRAFHAEKVKVVHDVLSDPKRVDPSDYPYAFCYDTQDLAQECWNRGWSEYQRTGIDIDLSEVLSQINSELEKQYKRFQKISGAGAIQQPPAQGNGAVTGPQTPGAKHPPTLSSEAASARAGGTRSVDRNEKRARAARLLKRTG